MRHRLGVGLASGVLLTLNLSAATFTVTNTNDSGAGSFRQAIIDADNNAGADTIAFNIPGSDSGCDGNGVCTIAPLNPLVNVTDPVTIDGYTQPGASVNTLAQGTNAVLKIVLSAVNLSNQLCFTVTGPATLRGLVFRKDWHPAIDVLGGTDTHITGCFFGVAPDGHTADPTAVSVVDVVGSGTVVGGPNPADRNLFAAATIDHIECEGQPGLLVRNNLFGTDAAGTSAIGPGVAVAGASPSVTILDNVMAAAEFSLIDGAGFGTVIQGNKLGTDATGTLPLGTGPGAITVMNDDVTIGGIGAGQGNIIAYSTGNGIFVNVVDGATIRGNSIHDNANLGIDVGNDGATPNDLAEADGIQNFPVLKSVTTGNPTHVQGLLHSTPSTVFDLDFYSNAACSNFPREFLEGETYLGSSQVTTDGTGVGSFDVSLPVATAPGARISVTATTPGGRTSEFSQRLPFSVTPDAGPAAAGNGMTIAGTDFEAGATVTVGGQPATDVSVNGFNQITGGTPALTPGSVNDLVVTNTNGTSGTLVKGWVSNFLDVESGNQFYLYVTGLVSNAITVGIGGGLYGVDNPTLRQQMAVFLLKAKHGLCYTPPPCAGTFSDVPCPSTFAAWIEAMAAEGITGGCGGGKFCPQNPVRRDQMAVFLLKGKHGSGYAPPACAGVFGDVPCPSTFADWIEQLAAEGITGGCGGGNYCPGSNNTRGQMAVFIVKTFSPQ